MNGVAVRDRARRFRSPLAEPGVPLSRTPLSGRSRAPTAGRESSASSAPIPSCRRAACPDCVTHFESRSAFAARRAVGQPYEQDLDCARLPRWPSIPRDSGVRAHSLREIARWPSIPRDSGVPHRRPRSAGPFDVNVRIGEVETIEHTRDNTGSATASSAPVPPGTFPDARRPTPGVLMPTGTWLSALRVMPPAKQLSATNRTVASFSVASRCPISLSTMRC